MPNGSKSSFAAAGVACSARRSAPIFSGTAIQARIAAVCTAVISRRR